MRLCTAATFFVDGSGDSPDPRIRRVGWNALWFRSTHADLDRDSLNWEVVGGWWAAVGG